MITNPHRSLHKADQVDAIHHVSEKFQDGRVELPMGIPVDPRLESRTAQMEKLTEEDIFARQAVVRTAIATATERYRACKSRAPEIREWASIREACMRESVRLSRIAERQRREQAA